MNRKMILSPYTHWCSAIIMFLVSIPTRPLLAAPPASTDDGKVPQHVVITDGQLYTTSAATVDVPPNTPVIVYDVDPINARGHFIIPLPTLKYNRRALIRLYNVNTIRNKYNVMPKSTDLHTGPQASGLGALFLTTAQPAPAGLSPLPTIGNDTLQKDFNSNAEAVKVLHKFVDPLQSVLRAMQDPTLTNAEIQYKCVVSVRDFLGANGDQTPNLPIAKDQARYGLTAKYGTDVHVIAFMPDDPQLNAFAEQLRNYDDSAGNSAQTKLKSTIDMWSMDFKTIYPTLQGSDAATALQMDLAVKMSARYLAQLPTDMVVSKLRQNVATAFAYVIDSRLTPVCIDYPIHVSGDVIQIEVDVDYTPIAVRSLDGASTQIAASAQVPGHKDFAQANVSGRFVVDYTAGMFVTGLHNRNYYGKPATDSFGNPVKIVTQGASDKTDLSFGALATFRYTNADGLSWGGPCIGFSTGTGSSGRYETGWSFVYSTHRTRILLSGGLAFGNVATLANGDQVGKPSVTGTVMTTPIFDHSWFASLTTNFSF